MFLLPDDSMAWQASHLAARRFVKGSLVSVGDSDFPECGAEALKAIVVGTQSVAKGRQAPDTANVVQVSSTCTTQVMYQVS